MTDRPSALVAVTALGAPLTRRQAFDHMRRSFELAQCDAPALAARLLLCDACEISIEQYLADDAVLMTPGMIARAEDARQRHAKHEPVSRIIGMRDFWQGRFLLGPDILDPRPDSETLVEAALELLPQIMARSQRAPRLLDLGTGSGCLLLSVLADYNAPRPNGAQISDLAKGPASGIGVDYAFGAAQIARENAALLTARGATCPADFIVGDWAGALTGVFDLVISNPPYIASGDIDGLAPNVRQFDPIKALDGGRDGLDAYRAICADLPRLLRPGGAVMFEIGLGQENAVFELLSSENCGFPGENIRFWPDLTGRIRVISALRADVASAESSN